jgi:hypothetical protein
MDDEERMMKKLGIRRLDATSSNLVKKVNYLYLAYKLIKIKKITIQRLEARLHGAVGYPMGYPMVLSLSHRKSV